MPDREALSQPTSEDRERLERHARPWMPGAVSDVGSVEAARAIGSLARMVLAQGRRYTALYDAALRGAMGERSDGEAEADDSGVAQLAEQRALNPQDPGSNPGASDPHPVAEPVRQPSADVPGIEAVGRLLSEALDAGVSPLVAAPLAQEAWAALRGHHEPQEPVAWGIEYLAGFAPGTWTLHKAYAYRAEADREAARAIAPKARVVPLYSHPAPPSVSPPERHPACPHPGHVCRWLFCSGGAAACAPPAETRGEASEAQIEKAYQWWSNSNLVGLWGFPAVRATFEAGYRAALYRRPEQETSR